MKNGLAGYAIKIIGFASVTFAFVCASALVATAQMGGANRPPQEYRGMSDRDRNLLQREIEMNDMIREANRPAPEVRQRLAMSQIAEDFKRIQVINNDMMLAVTSRPVLDYKRITDVVGEIKKRAMRLKGNLILPQPEEQAQKTPKHDALRETRSMLDELMNGAPDNGQIKNSLDTLDNLIMAFVNNPVFKNSGTVVDARMSAKANRDLENIIELSNVIRKSAERMSKGYGKEH